MEGERRHKRKRGPERLAVYMLVGAVVGAAFNGFPLVAGNIYDQIRWAEGLRVSVVVGSLLGLVAYLWLANSD